MATDTIPRCWICHQPVRLEDCKIDEQGRAVHEHCYAAMLARNKRVPPTDFTL